MKDKVFYSKLWKLVLPIAFQNLMTTAVSSADIIMLGFLDQNSLSAVSLAGQIQFVLNLFFAGLTIGTTILIAQYWGKRDSEAVNRVMGIALWFSALIALVFAVAAVGIPGALMRIFTTDPVLIELGIPYLRIVGFSYCFMSVSQIYLCTMKSTDRVVFSTVVSCSALVINILLNGVLIFGAGPVPAMGPAGAALATLIARVIECGICMFDSAKQKKVRIRLRYVIKRTPVLLKDFLRYSMPVLVNEIIWGCGFTMFSVIMGHIGSDAVAANSVANVVKNLAAVLCLGIASGGSILLGQELGQKNTDTAKLYAGRLCRLALLSGTLGGVLILLIRPLIFGAVSLTDTASGYLNGMLWISSFYLIGKAINTVTVAGIFCAGGDSKFGCICDLITMWFVIIPLGLLAAFVLRLPVMAVYLLISLDEFVKIPFVYRHYKKYGWLKNLTRDL